MVGGSGRGAGPGRAALPQPAQRRLPRSVPPPRRDRPAAAPQPPRARAATAQRAAARVKQNFIITLTFT